MRSRGEKVGESKMNEVKKKKMKKRRRKMEQTIKLLHRIFNPISGFITEYQKC